MKDEIEKIIKEHFKFEVYDYDKGNLYICNDFYSLVTDIEQLVNKRVLDNAFIGSIIPDTVKDLEKLTRKLNQLATTKEKQ